MTKSGRLPAVLEAIHGVIKGSDGAIELALSAFLAGGHVLLEGLPGTGKTVLARTIAAVFGGVFRRIQMTSDLLPSDIVGVMRLARDSREFEFRRGPIFANVVLADELNRTPPKTQSALLEAMAEATVTVDGVTHRLPDPFFVIATQNPYESHGVYPLTESQLDRFMLKITIERPSPAEELAIYERPPALIVSDVESLLNASDVEELRERVARVHVERGVLEYAAAVVRGTAGHSRVAAGASVRAGLQLIACARALSAIRGRDFVTPREISDLATAALAHRLFFREEEVSERERALIVHEVVAAVPAPI